MDPVAEKCGIGIQNIHKGGWLWVVTRRMGRTSPEEVSAQKIVLLFCRGHDIMVQYNRCDAPEGERK